MTNRTIECEGQMAEQNFDVTTVTTDMQRIVRSSSPCGGSLSPGPLRRSRGSCALAAVCQRAEQLRWLVTGAGIGDLRVFVWLCRSSVSPATAALRVDPFEQIRHVALPAALVAAVGDGRVGRAVRALLQCAICARGDGPQEAFGELGELGIRVCVLAQQVDLDRGAGEGVSVRFFSDLYGTYPAKKKDSR